MGKTVSEIVAKNQCMGCGACKNACPVDAIKMCQDKNGFLVPAIDKNLCIDCGMCLKVCPKENPVYHNEQPECYAVCAINEIRKVSSSGGMFTVLANMILERGGGSMWGRIVRG